VQGAVNAACGPVCRNVTRANCQTLAQRCSVVIVRYADGVIALRGCVKVGFLCEALWGLVTGRGGASNVTFPPHTNASLTHLA